MDDVMLYMYTPLNGLNSVCLQDVVTHLVLAEFWDPIDLACV